MLTKLDDGDNEENTEVLSKSEVKKNAIQVGNYNDPEKKLNNLYK